MTIVKIAVDRETTKALRAAAALGPTEALLIAEPFTAYLVTKAPDHVAHLKLGDVEEAEGDVYLKLDEVATLASAASRAVRMGKRGGDAVITLEAGEGMWHVRAGGLRMPFRAEAVGKEDVEVAQLPEDGFVMVPDVPLEDLRPDLRLWKRWGITRIRIVVRAGRLVLAPQGARSYVVIEGSEEAEGEAAVTVPLPALTALTYLKRPTLGVSAKYLKAIAGYITVVIAGTE